jgi:hypothetical protein
MEVVAAACVGEGACQEGFAHAGGAEDEDVEVLVDPFALGQLENEATIQAARRRKVKVFDGRRQWQPRCLQASFEAVVVAVRTLAVDEQAETILEGQVSVLGVVELLFEGGTEGRQAELGEFVEQRLGQHGTPP